MNVQITKHNEKVLQCFEEERIVTHTIKAQVLEIIRQVMYCNGVYNPFVDLMWIASYSANSINFITKC
jgi:hypothetical protein